jgi:hypothetical protein
MVNFRVGNYTTGEGLARRFNPKDQAFARALAGSWNVINARESKISPQEHFQVSTLQLLARKVYPL